MAGVVVEVLALFCALLPIHQIFIEHLLYAKHSARHQRCGFCSCGRQSTFIDIHKLFLPLPTLSLHPDFTKKTSPLILFQSYHFNGIDTTPISQEWGMVKAQQVYTNKGSCMAESFWYDVVCLHGALKCCHHFAMMKEARRGWNLVNSLQSLDKILLKRSLTLGFSVTSFSKFPLSFKQT